MLNVAEGPETDPEGKNAASPLLNVQLPPGAGRRPSTRERLSEERGAGLAPPANGPFPPGSIGYLEDTGYPAYDPAKADERRWTRAWPSSARDQHRVHVQHDERPVQRRDQHADHLDVDRGVRRQGAGDDHADRAGPVHRPGAHRRVPGVRAGATTAASIPTSSGCGGRASASAPIGALALNFGRFKDADIDAALDTIKTNPDPAARKAAAEAVNKRFGEQVYNLWRPVGAVGRSSRSRTSTASRPTRCRTAREGIGLAGAGRHQLEPDVVRRREVRVIRR